MPSPLRNAVRAVDGSTDFSNGVDSGRIPTIRSDSNPNGLLRSQLAWMTNCNVRGGGITQRAGWKRLLVIPSSMELYQGGWMYEPEFADPHLIVSIGGRIIRIRVDTDNSVEDLSQGNVAKSNPAASPQAFFCQGEQFLVIQGGDVSIPPLFYDFDSITNTTTLRRSNGITGNLAGPNINEIPGAGPMDYFMGRLWYANGRIYSAGDIVNGPSGTVGPPYYKRDSILKVTENPLALGGDGFIVPTQAGNIRALRHSANLDTQLGQGSLFIFTRESIYQLDVPVTRALWSTTTEPLQRVAQINFGAVSDRSIVAANGDLFYQTLEPGVRSLIQAVRNFSEWGNTSISHNENRVLAFNDRALMRTSSGILFDNRLWMTALPIQTPVGVASQAVMTLDFDLISSLGEKLPPAWQGIYEGLDILQLFQGDFGGLERAFAVVSSRLTGDIELWELTLSDRFDTNATGEARVSWYFETPAFTWGDPFMLKELDSGELWVDRVYGTVQFKVEYREDSSQCWRFWHAWQICEAKDCTEDPQVLMCPDYPTTPYCEGYRAMMGLPKPKAVCGVSSGISQARPSTIAYQFQVRVTIKGFARVRGILVYGIPREKVPYEAIVC